MANLIQLQSLDNAFTQGGNRLCFFHPGHKDRCIKIIRPDRTPEIRRKEKSFPKNLKPLNQFDENKNELLEINRIKSAIGEKAFMLIPRYFGLIQTDLGDGLSLEMIKDDDGKVSLSLKQYLWVNGVTEELECALSVFGHRWKTLGMPSRDLLLHNIVVQQAFDQNHVLTIKRLVVIDGLGWSGLPFLYYSIPFLARAKATKKVKKLQGAVKILLEKKAAKADWGYHGWLNEDQRVSCYHEQ